MDWNKFKEYFKTTDYHKYADKFVPEDQPPMTNWVSIIVLIVMVAGVVGTIKYNVGAILFSITVVLFILMIDSSLQLNYQIRQNGMAKADYLVALGIGGIFIFINTAIATTYFSPIQFPVSILISGLTFTMYELILLTLMRIRLDTETVYVEKHPKRPLDRYYIFTEEKYIPLLEESAMEKSPTDE